MLNISTIWIIIGVYLLFLLGIGLYENRKSGTSDYKAFVTGKGEVKCLFLVMTYLASLLNTWVFFAAPGAYYRGGLGYYLSELSYMCFLPVIMHFVMNKVWIINDRLSFTTPSECFYARYKSKPLRLLTAVIFLVSAFPYITSVLVSIGRAVNVITNGSASYNMVILVLGIVLIVYVCIGGIKSIAVTDTVQGMLFLAVLWSIVIAGLVIGFGGSVPDAFSTVWKEHIEWFSYPGPDGWVPYSARIGYPLSCIIGFTIMLPHAFVRTGYMGKSMKDQRRLMTIMPFLQAFVWTACMLIGLVGIALLPGMDTNVTELLIPYMIQNVFAQASPVLAEVLLCGFLIGVLAVGISTADSMLITCGSIISSDIIEDALHIRLGKKAQFLTTRVIIIVMGAISILLAINPPDLIYTLMMFACSIVMPMFPPLVFGIYWKKATKQAALVSVIAGCAVVLCTYFVWSVGDLWYGTFGLLTSAVCMVFVSLITYEKPEDSKEFYEALEEGSKQQYEPVTAQEQS